MAKKYIGVDVGGTSIKLGIVDDRGEVLIKKESIYTDEGDGRTAIQAIKDSITENTPRILETYIFKDSLLYKRILKWTHERDFHYITLLSQEDTNYNYRFYD